MSRARITLSPDIVERLRVRDAAAFDELLQVAGPPLLRFLTSYVRSRDVAEDLLQNVFLHIWELGPRFVPTGSVEAYLFGMARNEALGTLRKERIQERYLGRYAEELATDSTHQVIQVPEELPADDERAAAVARALGALTEHQRAAFELRYRQGLKIAEIAQVLGISEKGVERLMTRIKKLLAEQVLGQESAE